MSRRVEAEIDYYPEGASLLISLGGGGSEVHVAEAKVVIGMDEGRMTFVLVLLDDEEVAEKLSEVVY